MTQKRIHTLSLLAAITAAVIFGMSFMFSKLALEKAAPTVLLAVRFTVAVAAMTLVILVNALVGKLRGRPLFTFSLRGKPVYQLLLLGIVQPVAYFIFENYGILYTSSAVAGTIIAAVPVCCILMDVLVLHEKVTLKQVLCAVCAIGGVALISAGGAVMVSALGMLFLLLTMLSDTLYYGISHSAAKLFTPFEMTYVMFVVGMVVFIPVGLGTDTGCPYITHYDMWRELCYFVKYCGVTPAFALHSATLLNAELAGIADVTGSVEAGKAADLIVCPADPLADLTALRSLSMVIRDGWRLENPTVKKMPEVERELDKFL